MGFLAAIRHAKKAVDITRQEMRVARRKREERKAVNLAVKLVKQEEALGQAKKKKRLAELRAETRKIEQKARQQDWESSPLRRGATTLYKGVKETVKTAKAVNKKLSSKPKRKSGSKKTTRKTSRAKSRSRSKRK